MTESSWFYEPIQEELRLGDVVAGYTCITPWLSSSPESDGRRIGDLSRIDVVRLPYAVVLMPCCSIAGDTLVVSPLGHVKPNWFSNPYVSADFLRINARMGAEQAIPPTAWEKMDPEEKAARQACGPALSYLENFAFPSGGILPSYETSYKKDEHIVDCYIVDFRYPMLVHHNLPKASDQHSCGEKVLQLSPQARQLLRDKIAHYYSRPPVEEGCATRPKDMIVATGPA